MNMLCLFQNQPWEWWEINLKVCLLPQVDALVGRNGSVDELQECCRHSALTIPSLAQHVVWLSINLLYWYHLQSHPYGLVFSQIIV